MGNLSFELPGPEQGSAADWESTPFSTWEAMGIFNADICFAHWDYMESFMQGFTLPYYVHEHGDTVAITAPDATNWATAYTLLADISKQFEIHCLTTSNVHLCQDLDWVRHVWEPDSEAEAIEAANVLGEATYHEDAMHFPRGHVVAWPLVHRRGDFVNKITTPDATDESSTVARVNELKIKLNAHFILTRFGPTNEESKFEFSPSDLSPGTWSGLPYESFEAGWAIPDLVPEFIADQHDLVEMDTTATSWRHGHTMLISKLDYAAVEPGLFENFEKGYLLPGNAALWPNDKFAALYYKGDHFAFNDIQLQIGIFENFESGWKDCEIGAERYWDIDHWRFKSDISLPERQLEPAGFGSYSFAQFPLAGGPSFNPSLIPEFSPRLWVEVLQETTDEVVVIVTFNSEIGGIETAQIRIPVSEEGALLTEFALVGSTDFKRFEELFGGVQEIINLTRSPETEDGYLLFNGYRGRIELFESDWILTLE